MLFQELNERQEFGSLSRFEAIEKVTNRAAVALHEELDGPSIGHPAKTIPYMVSLSKQGRREVG
jgi:hypothetical protein